MIEAAIRLAKDKSRVVVFVKRPDDATVIAKAIRQHPDGQNKKLRPFVDSVEVLTGTMRGLERDQLLVKPVLKRFLDGEEKPEDRDGKEPAILVSTSAGEVGFDLNADHMVCDSAPLDSMIQRLGRVNRRGYGDATVEVFVAKAEENNPMSQDRLGKNAKHTYESAASEAVKCLENLEKTNEDGTVNASPKALDALKKTLTTEQLLTASTPKPTTVELTDILLDAWSMTTIMQPMPGRPRSPRGSEEWTPRNHRRQSPGERNSTLKNSAGSIWTISRNGTMPTASCPTRLCPRQRAKWRSGYGSAGSPCQMDRATLSARDFV